MLSRIEIDRLAAMANQLRPDWPVNSLTTFISRHRSRAYRDLAVALAWVATDAHTNTPARLDEAGPWWRAATAGDGSLPPRHYRVTCDEHPDQDMPCATCKQEAEAMTQDAHAAGVALVREALAAAPKYRARPERAKPERDLAVARARADEMRRTERKP